MSDLEFFTHWFKEHMGHTIHGSNEKQRAKTLNFCKSIGAGTLEECKKRLLREYESQELIESAAKEFTVNESYFFRDQNYCNLFSSSVVPSLIASGEKRAYFWSVGCSRGEELYTLAMLLNELIPNLQEWSLFLLGTDIHPDILATAKEGVFSEWSLRETPQFFKDKYFTKVRNRWHIDEKIKKMVRFEYHNVLSFQDPPFYKGSFHFISVRNILIYFEQDEIRRVFFYLYNYVGENGWLATTPAEYSPTIFKELFGYYGQKAPFVQKNEYSQKEKISPYTKRNSFVNVPIEDEFLQEFSFKPKILQKRYKNDLEKLYTQAIQKVHTQDIVEAKKLLRSLLYQDDASAEAYIALGNIMMQEGNKKGALKQMRKVKELLEKKDPQESMPYSKKMKVGELLCLVNAFLGGAHA